MARALFLVSTGRTGTTWLDHLFSETSARAFHEPGPKLIRHVAHAYASGHLRDARAQELLRRWRADVLAESPRPYVEASTLVYGLTRPILATFPEARVVHLVRDPLTFLRSGVNWGQYRFGGRLLNLAPFRRLAPPQFEPWYAVGSRVRWAATHQFERLCWAWSTMNRVIREQGDGNVRFSTLPYEHLFDPERGPATIRHLLSLVELELDDADVERLRTTRVNENKPGRFPEWRQWPDQHLATAIECCHEEAARYGYDLVGRVLEARPEVARLLPAARTAGV